MACAPCVKRRADRQAQWRAAQTRPPPAPPTAIPDEALWRLTQAIRTWREGLALWTVAVDADPHPAARASARRQIHAWTTELAAAERRVVLG